MWPMDVTPMSTFQGAGEMVDGAATQRWKDTSLQAWAGITGTFDVAGVGGGPDDTPYVSRAQIDMEMPVIGAGRRLEAACGALH